MFSSQEHRALILNDIALYEYSPDKGKVLDAFRKPAQSAVEFRRCRSSLSPIQFEVPERAGKTDTNSLVSTTQAALNPMRFLADALNITHGLQSLTKNPPISMRCVSNPFFTITESLFSTRCTR